MKFKRLSAALALALSLVMLLSGFTNVPGLGRIDYESEQEVAPDTTYIHIIGENTAAGGIVSVHVLDADVRAGRVLRQAVIDAARFKTEVAPEKKAFVALMPEDVRQEAIAQRFGYRLESHSLALYGLCADCQKKLEERKIGR